MVRSGLLATKVGMSRLFEPKTGRHISMTLLCVKDCFVVGQKTKDKDGYTALQLGTQKTSVSRLTKSLRGVFEKNKALKEPLKRHVEFRVDEANLLEAGHAMTPSHFEVGAHVDVIATSKGKGFQGAMKRHNFGGLRASHGVSISHRSHGSTGQCTRPGRVFKNKKMAGHLGAERVTTLNLQVVLVNEEKGWLAVKGSVPGVKGALVMVRDAVKHAAPVAS